MPASTRSLGLVAIVAVLGLARLLSETRDRPQLARAAAPGAAIGLVVLGLVRDPGTGPGSLVVAGLAVAAVGDVLHTHPAPTKSFRRGAWAFTSMALLYAGAAAWRGPAWIPAVAAGVVVALVAVESVRRVAPRLAPELRVTVPAYAGAAGLMIALSVGVGLGPGPRLLAGAAVVLGASDLLVARNRFLVSSKRQRGIALGLYYVAQLGFAWSVGLL